MKIRSITCFLNPQCPPDLHALDKMGAFIAAARPAIQAAGYEVQTARLATVPFPHILPSLEPEQLIQLAQQLETHGKARGFDYISLGPALVGLPRSYALIPEVIAATQNVFFSGMLTQAAQGVSLPAIRACAHIIHQVAQLSADGFANLRFAALANVPPGAPFFPAAYHSGDAPSFALATEAADLAVEAFSNGEENRNSGSLEAARQRLLTSIETHAARLAQVAQSLADQSGVAFGGLDFTLAPFPSEALSFGTALERLGAPAAGLHGSLAAAAILADTLDRARFPRAGFNGLMLPVLEDYTLAKRAAEGCLTVKDLLLYSAVCGTGLDTLPLPGNTSVEQLNSLLLDLAALAQRLGKPLTARLMPIPGKQAGDPTGFDFSYFANSRVLALDAGEVRSFFTTQEVFPLQPRPPRI